MRSSIIIWGDCRSILREWPDNCVDAVVTDPPYGLSSREPDMREVLTHWLAGDDYVHGGGGFMGKSWDSFVPGPSVWREVLRVLKPGGHALVFAGTRTYDLMTLSLRLAGFEVRDQLAWMYATGFPKSVDVSKAIDNSLGAERIVVEQRPAFGIGGNGCYGGHADGAVAKYCPDAATAAAAQWSGWGTALKPAQEPIALVRKPLIGTIARNVLTYGTGGINVDGCRVGDELMPRTKSDGTYLSSNGSMSGHNTGRVQIDPIQGRWPANVLLDETAAAMLDAQTGVSRFFYVAKASKTERERGLAEAGLPIRTGGELTDREDGSDGLNSPRAGAGRGGGRRNNHPTVKPIALMQYLVRLITPPGGLVLDPFTGSGSTGCAAKLENVASVGCELDWDYVVIARARIAAT